MKGTKEMEENIFLLEKFNVALKLQDNEIYSYDTYCDIIDYQSEGILKEVCFEYGQAIINLFHIKLSDYGIKVTDEVVVIQDDL